MRKTLLLLFFLTFILSITGFAKNKELKYIQSLLSPIHKGKPFYENWYWSKVEINNKNEIIIQLINNKIHKTVYLILRQRNDALPRYSWTKNFNIVFHIQGVSEGAKTPEHIENMMIYLIDIIRKNDNHLKPFSLNYRYKSPSTTKRFIVNNWLINNVILTSLNVGNWFQIPFLMFTFFISIIVLLIKIPLILNSLKIRKASLIWLICIIALSAFLRFIAPSNIVRTGEHGYESNAIAMEPPIKTHPYGIGFFNFFEFFYQFLPKDDSYIFLGNKILGTLSTILIFTFSYLLFNSEVIALFSSLLFATLPVHIKHSASESMFILQIFFALLTLNIFLLFIQTNDYWLYFASILLLNYSIQIRPEWIVFFIIILFLFLIKDNNLLQKVSNPMLWLGFILFLFISHAHFVHIASKIIARESTIEGITLDINSLILIIRRFFSKNNIFFDFNWTPFWYLIYFIFGSILMFFNRKREFLFLFFSISLFSSIYLLTNAGTFSDRLVFQNSYQMFFILAAGYTAFIFIKSIGIHKNSIITLFFILLTLSGPLLYKNFIIEKYNPQNEYSFLKATIPSLSFNNCNFIKLEDDDGPKKVGILTGFPWYMMKGNYNSFSITELKNHEDYIFREKCIIYYRALSCYRFAGFEQVTGLIRPECQYVENNFSFIPIKETSFKNKGYFSYVIPSDNIKIGFYYLKRKFDKTTN